MKLVVGLGNPGKKYSKTKHNIGFISVDHYVDSNNLKLKKERKFNGKSLKIGDLVLLKPHTFMNNSGLSIKAVMDYYDIDIKDILVIYDDLDLPLGKTRLREKGSAGGHNGIKSIISHLKTEEFRRVRVGIDKNPVIETKNYVLSSFSKKEIEIMNPVYSKISEIIEDFKNNKEFTYIMTKYN
ncbi:MAG: Peptidyl-tRNA hydrolase [Candidatus Izimaplasma bacterium HR2]|nr:MAG: Peptidyl-tRNA hydrolase [Candidatus Izimaplasma bacterium HR2]